ncbi:thioredoxin fold domain-containing protein [Hippea maritima]|uniref:Thiol:disulfide interchange protein, DsbC n=1 Tax=Hippea maritima (strain ATCC 700847 / DSM 10411 / MH2) TaxID=760142 RepID=F2LV27_HIPMA|nr:thioredoxin fold domain-containing protein [Hippea maritima]AEA33611.1 thiol:disulfide interchange protein, DsbC [Hippea maritima DSM 10411]
MRKAVRNAALATAIVVAATAVYGSPNAFAQNKIPSVCKGINLNEHVPMPPYRIMSVRDVHGLCEMILDIKGELVPVYATKDFIVAGDMFSHRKQITERQIWKVRSNLLKNKFKTYKKDLENLVVAEFNPKAKKYVYFFVDPLCPYCEKAKSELTKLAQKHNFGIKLVFFPVHGKPAVDDIKGFICSHKTFKDYLNDNYEGDTNCDKAKNYIDKSIDIGRSLGVQGTPTIITDNGDYILGYQPKVILKDLGR